MRKFIAGGKYIKKTDCLLLPVLVLMLTLSGCSRAGKVEIPNATADDNISSDSDAGDIEKHISYTISNSDGETKLLDADVTAEGYDKAGVYDMEFVNVDETYLRRLAGQLFDDGEYEVVKPYEACSMEELTAEKTHIQQLYAEAGIEEDALWLAVDGYIDRYDEAGMEEWQEGQFFRYETDDIVYGDVERKSAILRGKIEDKEYQLKYEEPVMETEYINRGSLDLYALCPVNRGFSKMCDADFEQASVLYGENVCSREQAERVARDMVQKLGFSDMQEAYTSHIIWYRGEEQYADGYSVVFTRGVDGIPGIFCENSLVLLDEEYAKYTGDNSNLTALGSYQEYIEVHVDSSGFLGCNFNVFYEMGERLTEETAKLSFEQVCMVAEQYMADNIDSVGFVQEIRMGYLTLRYEDDRYVLAPVWVYLLSGRGDKSFAFFGVNALDGSIVHFEWDIVYGHLLWFPG